MSERASGAARRRRLIALLLLIGAAVVSAAALLLTGQGAPLAGLWQRDATWQAMQSRASWRVGLDPSFPPFEMLDADGAVVGYDVELARSLAANWGMDVEIVTIGFDSLLDALRAAKIDAIVSAYPYDERLTRDVAFSQPYFDAGLQLAVRSGSSIQGVDDLAGRRVAVEWGSEGDMIGRQLQRQGIALELVPFETPQDAVAAALAGSEVDALLIDGVTLRTQQAGGAPLTAVGPYLTSNPYVIVVPHRATELLAQTDAALTALRDDGLLQQLETEWFGR